MAASTQKEAGMPALAARNCLRTRCCSLSCHCSTEPSFRASTGSTQGHQVEDEAAKQRRPQQPEGLVLGRQGRWARRWGAGLRQA